jgi:hypothetical protein
LIHIFSTWLDETMSSSGKDWLKTGFRGGEFMARCGQCAGTERSLRSVRSVFLCLFILLFVLSHMDEDSFASPVAKTFERIFGDGRLRVVSYNVCGFGAGFKENVDTEEVTRVYGRLRKDLSDLKADIICLNEVKRISVKDPEGNDRDDTLEALAEDLEEMEYFFAHANPGYESFGNAILVSRKLQVIHCDSAHLEGGSYVPTPKGDKHIGRGCLAVPCRLNKTISKLFESQRVTTSHTSHETGGTLACRS